MGSTAWYFVGRGGPLINVPANQHLLTIELPTWWSVISHARDILSASDHPTCQIRKNFAAMKRDCEKIVMSESSAQQLLPLRK